MKNIVHVEPINDLKEHDTSGQQCWCNPEAKQEDNVVIVVHNSLDGREFVEQGNNLTTIKL